MTLNADLLDGLSESAFVRSTGDTMTGKITINTATSPYGFLAYGNTAGGYAALENGDHTSYAYLGRDGYGVFANNNAADGYGIWAQNLTAGGTAGFFRGDVDIDGDVEIDGELDVFSGTSRRVRYSASDYSLYLYDSDGNLTIEFDADYFDNGRIITEELQITGGSDLSEQLRSGADRRTGRAGHDPQH